MSQPIQLINGQWLTGLGHHISSVNPARNDVIWQGQAATAKQVDIAIKSARTAFESWSMLAFENRIAIVEKFAEQLGAIKKHSPPP